MSQNGHVGEEDVCERCFRHARLWLDEPCVRDVTLTIDVAKMPPAIIVAKGPPMTADMETWSEHLTK